MAEKLAVMVDNTRDAKHLDWLHELTPNLERTVWLA